MLDPEKKPTKYVELCDAFCEYLWENWSRYNGTAHYNIKHSHRAIYTTREHEIKNDEINSTIT